MSLPVGQHAPGALLDSWTVWRVSEVDRLRARAHARVGTNPRIGPNRPTVHGPRDRGLGHRAGVAAFMGTGGAEAHGG